VLWHERLAKLDEKYNLEQFVHLALDMNSEHPNLSIVNRILDILDALRQGQPQSYDMPQMMSPNGSEGSETGSDVRDRLKLAFQQKLKEYQNNEVSPTVVRPLKRAFIAKIRKEQERMERELAKKKATMGDKLKQVFLQKLERYKREQQEVEEAFPSPMPLRDTKGQQFFSSTTGRT